MNERSVSDCKYFIWLSWVMLGVCFNYLHHKIMSKVRNMDANHVITTYERMKWRMARSEVYIVNSVDPSETLQRGSQGLRNIDMIFFISGYFGNRFREPKGICWEFNSVCIVFKPCGSIDKCGYPHLFPSTPLCKGN